MHAPPARHAPPAAMMSAHEDASLQQPAFVPPRVGGGYDLTRRVGVPGAVQVERPRRMPDGQNAASLALRRQLRRDRARGNHRGHAAHGGGVGGGGGGFGGGGGRHGGGGGVQPSLDVPVEIYVPASPGPRRSYTAGPAFSAHVAAERASAAASKAAAMASHANHSSPPLERPRSPSARPRSPRSPSVSPELAHPPRAGPSTPAALQSAMQQRLREAAGDCSAAAMRSVAFHDDADGAPPPSASRRRAASPRESSISRHDATGARHDATGARHDATGARRGLLLSQEQLSQEHLDEAAAGAAAKLAAAASAASAAKATSAPSAAREGTELRAESMELLRDGRAVSEDALIAQLRSGFVSDLSYADKGGAPSAAVKPNAAATAAAAVSAVHSSQASSQASMALLGNFGGADEGDGAAKRNALSSLLAMRAKEIEATQREQCAKASRQLVEAYQQNVARLQAVLVRQLTNVSEAAQRNTHSELQAFMQLGLPAIQHILSSEIASEISSEIAQPAPDLPAFPTPLPTPSLTPRSFAPFGTPRYETSESVSAHAHHAAAAAARAARAAAQTAALYEPSERAE